MPYKDKSMKSQRQKGRRKGEAPAIVKPQNEAPIISQEHPVLKYLVPGEKRVKMVAIIEALNHRKLTGEVLLGCGKNSLPLDFVGELLETTK